MVVYDIEPSLYATQHGVTQVFHCTRMFSLVRKGFPDWEQARAHTRVSDDISASVHWLCWDPLATALVLRDMHLLAKASRALDLVKITAPRPTTITEACTTTCTDKTD
jgi:hypothetical protein